MILTIELARAIYKAVETIIRNGDPDPSQISTSYVQCQNLTIRMWMHRFTRLTIGSLRRSRI